MPAVEFWVMKLIADADAVGRFERNEAPGHWVEALLRGEVYCINGEIMEPVEVFDNDQQGAIARAMKEHARTGKVHKVILNAEL